MTVSTCLTVDSQRVRNKGPVTAASASSTDTGFVSATADFSLVITAFQMSHLTTQVGYNFMRNVGDRYFVSVFFDIFYTLQKN